MTIVEASTIASLSLPPLDAFQSWKHLETRLVSSDTRNVEELSLLWVPTSWRQRRTSRLRLTRDGTKITRMWTGGRQEFSGKPCCRLSFWERTRLFLEHHVSCNSNIVTVVARHLLYLVSHFRLECVRSLSFSSVETV